MGSSSAAEEALIAVIVLFTIIAVFLVVAILVILLWARLVPLWRRLWHRGHYTVNRSKEPSPVAHTFKNPQAVESSPKSSPRPNRQAQAPQSHPLQTRVVYRPTRSSLPLEGEEKKEIWLTSSTRQSHFEPVKGGEADSTDSPSSAKPASRRASQDLASAEGGGASSGTGLKRSLARVSVASIASQLSNFSSKLGMSGQRKSMDLDDDSVELMLSKDSSSEGSGSQPTSPIKQTDGEKVTVCVGSPELEASSRGGHTEISVTD